MNIKPLSERDGKRVNNWYILCLASEVAQKPIRRIMYDKPYVIFRDENGGLSCLEDRCLHRGTKLSEGQCKNGQIVCPYHGWTYDKHGHVTDIPSEGPDKNSRYKIARPHQYEKNGVLWICPSQEMPLDAIPTWTFPYAEDPAWTKYFMITDFDNEVTNLVENFMDVAHTVYVHAGWFRNKAQIKVPMSIETKEGAVLVTYNQENDKIGGITNRLLNPKGVPMTHTDKFIYPNITRVDYSYNNEYGFVINSQITPISTLKSRVYTYIAYKLVSFNWIAKPFVKFYTRQVIEQDVAIMRNQGENLKLDISPRFRSTEADTVHLAIEKLRDTGKEDQQAVNLIQSSKNKEFWI
ncbi:aromatic ring-hydroxylating dioxygenase subunit alpha [Paraglaciecola sp. 25GB23A]|uniref:aromatic ring-hydroxylating dioxygenase subunit alpha n=1 Tax=Paraglaciecola sp. 25GB23A TaxID=3156068 RepID=UPI0032B01B8D